jgi:hypothetical protein
MLYYFSEEWRLEGGGGSGSGSRGARVETAQAASAGRVGGGVRWRQTDRHWLTGGGARG